MKNQRGTYAGAPHQQDETGVEMVILHGPACVVREWRHQHLIKRLVLGCSPVRGWGDALFGRRRPADFHAGWCWLCRYLSGCPQFARTLPRTVTQILERPIRDG